MTELIDREIKHQEAGRQGRITAKLNRIADQQMIEKLYEASNAGVKIELIVRGICMLRPGVPGLSENIRVINVVGRFLEHSRIFHFANGGNDEVFIGSADLMSRNLKNRVEVVAPIEDLALKTYLKDVVLPAYLQDNAKAHELLLDGKYVPITVASGDGQFNSQESFIRT
jgi:polyphosphate kinase